MYPVFGIRGATWFLGTAEWTFGMLLLIGFWNKQLGVLVLLGHKRTFRCRIVLWDHASPRQAHKKNASRPI
jgi:hypothetical protein